jgi:alkanesulfonate monooxygenase SsuD/methylene tetrahydromethanopterin reductase-like flavin-dependent oxidoreductase (luciferase family)
MTEEFAALGASFPERGAWSDECLQVLRALWTRATVSFAGKYSTFQDMQISPLPVQQHVPIWVGGISARARRRVAEFGDGGHAITLPPDELTKAYRHLTELWNKKGRAGKPVLSMRAHLFINGVSDEVLSYPPRPGSDLLRGDLEMITARLHAYQEVGVQHMVFELSTQSFEGSRRTMETFMSKIKPQLHDSN